MAAWDTRRLAARLAVVGGKLGIALPAAGRRSCMAPAVVVVACLAEAWPAASAAAQIVALLASRQRTLHRRH